MGSKNLVLVGDSAFAEVAFAYFQQTNEYNVVGFSVEKEFLRSPKLCGLPVVPFETVETFFPPETHSIFVAIVYTELNRLRTRLMKQAKAKGYALARYISQQATISPNSEIGEQCFIFENNVVQPFTTISQNCILWSGNHLGHHSVLEENCFISSHVVISGFSRIKSNSFMGVNSSCADRITIAEDNWIGPNCCITKNTEVGQIFRAPEPQIARVSSLKFFKVPSLDV